MKLLSIASKVANAGVEKAAPEDKRHVRVLNSAGALGVIILANYDTFYFFLDLENLYPLILLNLVFTAGYLSVIGCNLLGWNRASQFLLFAAAFSNITSATAFLSTASGIHLLFIGLAAMALISARANNYAAKITLVVISTVLLVITQVSFEIGIAPVYPSLVMNIIMGISIAATISLVVIPMALYQYYLESAEKVVMEKEGLLRTALETMSDGIYVLDDDLNFTMFNDRYLKLVGLPNEAITLGGAVRTTIEAHAKLGDYGDGNLEELISSREAALASEDSIER